MNKLLSSLSKRELSDTVFNPYRNKSILNNLRLYLEYIIKNKPDMLIIGEAPGYKGCGITGVPFTSGKIIKNAKHKIFREIGSQIKLQQVISENTAKILWDFIEDKPVPILWNAFPFHPHKKDNIKSNRKPNAAEIEEGKEYLKMIYELFKPKKLCSLGRIGETTLKNLFPDKKVIYIRHPSYGGKKDFIKGVEILF